MSTVLILLVGVAIVIGGILVFRLHAFLVLIAAALVVSMLTPGETLVQYQVNKNGVKILSYEKPSHTLRAEEHWINKDQNEPWSVNRRVNGKPTTVANAILRRSKSRDHFEVLADAYLGEYEFKVGDRLVSNREYSAAKKFSEQTFSKRVAAGFGGTCVKIGILIAMAAIIGRCLLESGAAQRIVQSALGICGERNAPYAFAGSSFLLSIPVFFDTVFFLMIPLAKALRLRTGKNYLLYVLAIFAGGTMAHSLVPPTPGPLFVAEELNVHLAMMVLVGIPVGLIASGAGFLFAMFASSRWKLPLRDAGELPSTGKTDGAEMLSILRKESDLPPLWFSLLPIVLPLLLLCIFATSGLALGDKNVALTISAALAILLLVRSPACKSDPGKLTGTIQTALSEGGVIILITAAGGAFGQAMQQTGVASLIQTFPQGTALVTLPLAFGVTTLIRTAQGSATVAMITSVGILSGIATPEELGFHPVYLAIAIGCGSKPLSWMNDSGFWVICKMSGMTEPEGLKSITPMSGVMGVVGLLVTLIAATLLPLV